MMRLEKQTEKYRIFSDKRLGIWPFFVLEDSSKAVQKQGTWIGVKFQNFYFKSLKQVIKIAEEL